jgi:hypothetical protein
MDSAAVARSRLESGEEHIQVSLGGHCLGGSGELWKRLGFVRLDLAHIGAVTPVRMPNVDGIEATVDRSRRATMVGAIRTVAAGEALIAASIRSCCVRVCVGADGDGTLMQSRQGVDSSSGTNSGWRSPASQRQDDRKS